MSQTLQNPSVETGKEEQIALIERGEKLEDWCFRLMIPAVFLLLIVGTVILLS